MRRIIIAVLVVVALFVVVDFGAASAAEYQVSKTMRQKLGLPQSPEIRIAGFPFLLQAAFGDYKKVDLVAQKLTVGDLHDVGLHAVLYHARLPLRDLLAGRTAGLSVDDVRGSVLITKEDLVRRLGVSKLEVEPVEAADLDKAQQNSADAAPGSSVSGLDPDRAVKLVATTNLAGKEMKATVIAALELSGQEIRVVPRDIRVGWGAAATKLPAAAQAQLRRMFTLRLQPGTLPFNATPTQLKAVDRALEITGSAKDVRIGDAGSPGSTG
jgi:hypothetical protein